ncbi:hypothetical protein ES703_60438 [subsurface metagenome]
MSEFKEWAEKHNENITKIPPRRKRVEEWARKAPLTRTPPKTEITKSKIIERLKYIAFTLHKTVIPAMERGDYDTAASISSQIVSILQNTETDIFILWKKER